MVIIHANEMRIFTAATSTIPVSRAPADAPDRNPPIQAVSGKCRAVAVEAPSAVPSANSIARSARMHTTTPRIVAST